MTKLDIYHVDAFTSTVFSGNPAAVCVLESWLSDCQLNMIAKENNLPVTAFLVRNIDQYEIRWITPEYELDLCGHGSLAASYIIFNCLEPSWQCVTLSSVTGLLLVKRDHDLITLDFLAKKCEKVEIQFLEQGLGLLPKEIYQYKNERVVALYGSEEEVRALKPDIQRLKQLSHRGIIVTAPGVEVDFVSRTFYPEKFIYEDAVTGASHCMLAPFWADRLGKSTLHAWQVSRRGGEIFCEHRNDRVLISGRAVLYMRGVVRFG